MNERIKELAEQAGMKPCADMSKFGMNEDMNPYNCQEFMLEKFAELIVQKCVQELEASKKGDIYTGDLFNCEWNDCIDSQIAMLKEEFGLDS